MNPVLRALTWPFRASGATTQQVLASSWEPSTHGHVDLVPSMGVMRSATFRTIYLTNPYVYAAVNKKAGSIGRLPIHVHELDEKGRKRRLRGDALEQLLSRPTAGISRNAMIGGTVRDRLVYGNGLWEIKRDGGSVPVGLERVEWRDVVRVVANRAGRVYGYEVRDRDTFTTRGILPRDVVHFGLGSDEGACGVSPLASCRSTIALHDALTRHLIAYFKNAMRPSGHISVDKLTKDKLELIQEAIEELYASPENAGKVLVTSGKWEGISDTLEHSQIIELLKSSREEIAAAYEIPPPVLGILDHAIKSNVKELREQYGRDSIGPLASDFEQDLMAQLVTPVQQWSGLFVEFQLAELLRPDLEARATVYQKMASILTIDEIRGIENMAPLDIEGVTDVPWAQSGSMPLTTAAQGRQGRAV